MESKTLSNIKSLYNYIIGFIFTSIIFLSLFFLYDLVTEYDPIIPNSVIVSIIFILYWYILYCSISIIGLIREFDKIIYLQFFFPFIPVFFIFLNIYQTRKFTENDIGIILITYALVLLITTVYLRLTSSRIISHVGGKDIGGLGDDFFITTVISSDNSYQIIQLIKATIINILGYKLKSIDQIYIEDRKYKIRYYSRKYAPNIWYSENILLLELIIETDEDPTEIKEFHQIEEFEIVDNDIIENECEYSFAFLYQFADLGDSIVHIGSEESELGLALKSILPDNTFIYQYKNTDITPVEIRSAIYTNLQNYLTIKHGALIDSFQTKVKNELQHMKDSHKTILRNIMILVLIIILSSAVFNFFNSLDISSNTTNTLVVIGTILTIIYTSLGIMSYFKNNIAKNK